MSITRVDYIVLDHVVKEAIWICKFINKIADEPQLDMVVDMTLQRDNEINITLTKNVESQY